MDTRSEPLQDMTEDLNLFSSASKVIYILRGQKVSDAVFSADCHPLSRRAEKFTWCHAQSTNTTPFPRKSQPYGYINTSMQEDV